ncbi:MAG: LPS export ABC transporter periplasmic protein LptC [Flavobacteriaceae bacterium]|nr:LPS export ABC transporter periplasmic protein LptC [Flavobacteriaceae bacterium]
MAKYNYSHITKSIITIVIVIMLFSCENNMDEINDFIADKNLPISVTKDIYLIHTDSGYVKSKMSATLLHDFTNRKNHPYHEFPNGIKIVTFDNKDSTTITAKYAITYKKTQITEIKGNVIVLNHIKKLQLKTEQLFWDQKENYYFSNKRSILTSTTDTLIGKDGFDARSDLTNANMMDNSAKLNIKEN